MNIPYLREVEYNECWLHFHRNMEMIYVVDGELEGKIDDIEYIFLKDDIVFIPNYLKHIFSKKTIQRLSFSLFHTISEMIFKTFSKIISSILNYQIRLSIKKFWKR